MKQETETVLSQESIDLIQGISAASATATECTSEIANLKEQSQGLKAQVQSFADSVANIAIQVAIIEGGAIPSKVMAEMLGEEIASGKVRKYWADGVKVYSGLAGGKSITVTQGEDSEQVTLESFTNADIESPKVSKVASAIRKADKEHKAAITDAINSKVTACEAFIESNGAIDVTTIAGESLSLKTGEDCVSALNSGLLTDDSMVTVLNAKRDGEDIIEAVLKEQERLADIQASIDALTMVSVHIEALQASEAPEAQAALDAFYASYTQSEAQAA